MVTKNPDTLPNLCLVRSMLCLSFSHVNLSVFKLLSRIVAPTDMELEEQGLHDHTYGITSDPLTQFSCGFSALIHDVDHSGVPNTTLIQEKTAIAKLYNGRSVAEQNSFCLAWDLLMDTERFGDLQAALYSTEEELRHFRHLVVNMVMVRLETCLFACPLVGNRLMVWASN